MPPANAVISKDQRNAMRGAMAMQQSENHDGIRLSTQDEMLQPKYVIYIYNILNREYVVRQPPKWPAVRIPACPKGDKFSFTVLPAFTRETFFDAGDPSRTYYRNMDGRKDAMSLLNPASFPGTQWESQLANWDSEETAITGSGNNLNAWGVFWSMTPPDEIEKLDEEIKFFRDYVANTMTSLVKAAELLAAQGKLQDVTPNMHFAMDYLGKQAPWHMTMDHMVSCPNCGDVIKDGIAYHRNSFGDKCIVDYARCVKLGIVKPEEEQEAAPAAKKSGRKSAA